MEKRKIFKNQRVRRMLIMVNEDSGSDNDNNEEVSVQPTKNIHSDDSVTTRDNVILPLDLEYIPSPDRGNQLYIKYLNENTKSPSAISNISVFLENIDFIASPKIIHKVSSNVSTPIGKTTYCLEGEKTLLDLDTQFFVPQSNQNELTESLDRSIIEVGQEINQSDDTADTTPDSPSIIQIPLEDQLQNDICDIMHDDCTGTTNDNCTVLEDDNQLGVNMQEYAPIDSPTSPDSHETSRLTRKRLRHEKEWTDNKNKRLKNCGKAYTSVRSKKNRPVKAIKDICSCNKQCYAKINSAIRQSIFHNFWKLGDHEQQWQYILRYVSTEEVKKISVVRKNNRTQTIKYFLPIDTNNSEQVCKKFFVNTLSISDKFVYTAIDKGHFENTIKDKRGLHYNRPQKMDILTEESIIKHIKIFPTKESHYIRQQSKRLYLSQDLNISEMYRLYVVWFNENREAHVNVKLATKNQYQKIFNTRFNYSFFKPKKDRCATCSLYEDADDERKKEMEIEYQAHRVRKDLIREMKTKEKQEFNASDTVIAIFDLEKVLNVPQSNVGIFHYKRKYPIYNFTVYNSLTGKGHCYVWHFQIAKRGAVEIGSCLLKFMVSEVNKGIKRFSFYSDSCAGQNKNRFIFALYVYLAQKYNIELTHRFFEVGHSQSEGDSMHSCIERAKHNKIIYTPEQMYAIIINAKKTGEKYDVNEMNQSDFFDIKSLTSGKNWIKDSNGKKILWSKIKEVCAKHSEPDVLMFKYEFDDEYSTLLTQNKPKQRGRRAIPSTPGPSSSVDGLLPAYRKPLEISKALYDDLMSLCNNNAIPPAYQEFYRQLNFDSENTSSVDFIDEQDPNDEN